MLQSYRSCFRYLNMILQRPSKLTGNFRQQWQTCPKWMWLLKMVMLKITAMMKVLNLIGSKVVVSTKLTVEGPLRMKEEDVEGVIESPRVDEGTIPEQLCGVFDQADSTLQQLLVPITDTLASGLKIPLNKHFFFFYIIIH